MQAIPAVASVGRADAAFELAEEHHAFDTLVPLIFDYAPSPQDRVQYYLTIFGPAFGFVLFEWYIKQGTPWIGGGGGGGTCRVDTMC